MVLFAVKMLQSFFELNHFFPSWNSIKFFVRLFDLFILLKVKHLSFFCLILIDSLILNIRIFDFEVDVLDIFHKSYDLLSFDLHMIIKLLFMHQILVS